MKPIWTEEQIVCAPKLYVLTGSIQEVCQKMNISEANFYSAVSDFQDETCSSSVGKTAAADKLRQSLEIDSSKIHQELGWIPSSL